MRNLLVLLLVSIAFCPDISAQEPRELVQDFEAYKRRPDIAYFYALESQIWRDQDPDKQKTLATYANLKTGLDRYSGVEALGESKLEFRVMETRAFQEVLQMPTRLGEKNGHVRNVNLRNLFCAQLLYGMALEQRGETLAYTADMSGQVVARANKVSIVRFLSVPSRGIVYARSLDRNSITQQIPEPTESFASLPHGKYRFLCKLTDGNELTKDQEIVLSYDEVDFKP